MAKNFTYPVTRMDGVVEDYHGTPVADPYRWLEDPDSSETQAWVDAQNELTFGFLEGISARAPLQKRLTEIWDFPKYFAPHQKGGRYFFLQNDGLQNQPVLYMQTGIDGEPRPVLDPNTLSEDGTVALTNAEFSKDGRLLAYATSASGSDWQDIRVRDVDTGEDFPEVLKWSKFATIAWKPDGSGFYYNAYPEPTREKPAEQLLAYNSVYWHQVGTSQADDVLVYQRPELNAIGFMATISDDERYLVMTILQSFDHIRIYYRPLDSETDFIPLIDEADANYIFLGNDGPLFYFQTDLDAPRGRVVAVDIENPTRENWREIIPESEDVLPLLNVYDTVSMINNRFVAVYMHDAHHLVRIYGLDGTFEREVMLPALGSVTDLTGERQDQELFIQFQSFLYAPSVFRYNFQTGQLTPFRQPEIDFDASAYETTQVFYPSKDGTRVPMFLTHKKGLELNGDNPVLMYAYGGFNINVTPMFSVPRLAWLENGGIFAQPNLRGGGEYGDEWHKAGMLASKQNVFDDFISAGEWLIANKYTRREKLAINGASNGGLLVSACMVQRPDLFGAVICQVPVTDMLRYHKFTVGRFWTSEYGNAEEDADHFEFMYAYSPLHNVKPGTTFPPTLITTADHDDRVVPMHSEKFAAALQAADSGDNPILIRIETKAGHGAGKPTSKMIDESADIYAFLSRVFNMTTS